MAIRTIIVVALAVFGGVRAPAGAGTAAPPVDTLRAAALERIQQATRDKLRGRFADAERGFRRALPRLEHTLGPADTLTVEAGLGLGECLGFRGDYAGAEALLRRLLGDVVDARGERNAAAGELMLGLADVLSMRGRHPESTRFNRRAAVILEAVYGGEHPRYAAALAGLAHTERRMGNSGEAISMYRRCIEIVERYAGDRDPELVHYRSRLGMSLFERQHFSESIGSIERAIADATAIYGEDSYQVALEQRHLGLVLEYVQRWDEAYALFRRSLATLERYFGRDHPYLSKCLKGLAGTCTKLGQLDEAYRYIRHAVTLHGQTSGADLYELSYLLNLKSLIEVHLERWDDALATEFRATETSQEILEDILQAATSREALLYAYRPQTCASNLVGTAAAHPRMTPGGWTEVFVRFANTNGQVLDWLAERRRYLDGISDTSSVALARARYARAAQRVADIAVGGPAGDGAAYRDRLARARREQEDAERAVSDATRTLRASISDPGLRARITMEALTGNVPAGATVIQFVRFPKWMPGESSHEYTRLIHYGAFRLQFPDDRSRVLPFVDLGAAQAVDSLVFVYRDAVDVSNRRGRPTARDEAEFRRAARGLYDLVWAPLFPAGTPDSTAAVPEGGLVFVIPVSWLHTVDFNTLLSPAGRLVIEDRRLHRLSSVRDLVRSPDWPHGEGLVAVGNPARVGPGNGGGNAAATILCEEAYRHPVPLPGAEAEIRAVAGLYTSATGETATVLSGTDGSEGTVKQLLPGKRVVHFATHGFFCEEASRNTAATPERLLEPLLMSGLVLAGGPDDGDGLLTAQEVVGLDLGDTDWVVLSACGSGLGRLIEGEGMFGLRRAFEIAGARTVLMALWRIQDGAVPQLMERIYGLRLAGFSTVDAVRSAQLERLRDERRRFNRIHPVLWGGIVAEGDWR